MTAPRQPLPDLVRVFALCGIAVVNVDYFAHATMGGVIAGAWDSPADRAAWWTVATLFMLKSYSLFALMFGVGVAQQMLSAAGDGAGFGGRYARRLIGLLVLGLFNAALLFYGDILVIYALLGTLVYLFRDLGAATLRRWAIGLYLVQAAIVLLLWLSTFALTLPEAASTLREALDESAQDTAQRVAGFAAPGVLVVAATRFEAWATDLVWMVAMQGLGALAFMLYGLHLARSGLLEDTASARWARARRIDLPLGLTLAGVGGWLMVGSGHELDPSFMGGFALIVIGSPFSTMGYLGLLAAWSQRPASPLRAFLTRAGGGSLTAYLLQGLLLSLVFSGYGLGLVGQLGAAAYIPIGAAAALLSVLFVGWWRIRYPLGPVETLLRRWVYLGERRSGV
jgi:uncharacterized protein